MKRLRPFEAKSFRQICSLKRDNINTRNSWMILNSDGNVVIANQRNGHECTGQVSLTPAEMRKLARWYLTGRTR